MEKQGFYPQRQLETAVVNIAMLAYEAGVAQADNPDFVAWFHALSEKEKMRSEHIIDLEKKLLWLQKLERECLSLSEKLRDALQETDYQKDLCRETRQANRVLGERLEKAVGTTSKLYTKDEVVSLLTDIASELCVHERFTLTPEYARQWLSDLEKKEKAG